MRPGVRDAERGVRGWELQFGVRLWAVRSEPPCFEAAFGSARGSHPTHCPPLAAFWCRAPLTRAAAVTWGGVGPGRETISWSSPSADPTTFLCVDSSVPPTAIGRLWGGGERGLRGWLTDAGGGRRARRRRSGKSPTKTFVRLPCLFAAGAVGGGGGRRRRGRKGGGGGSWGGVGGGGRRRGGQPLARSPPPPCSGCCAELRSPTSGCSVPPPGVCAPPTAGVSPAAPRRGAVWGWGATPGAPWGGFGVCPPPPSCNAVPGGGCCLA